MVSARLPAEDTKIENEIRRFLRQSLSRLDLNLVRVESLLRAAKPKNAIHPPDILRAAVVLLHACLEDFLRNTAVYCLSMGADSKALDGIPLVGLENKKFELADLARHQHKAVRRVVVESIKEYFALTSFSKCDQIRGTLIRCGLASADVEGFYPVLAKLIERRHQIVHRADLKAVRAKRANRMTAIKEITVREWEKAVNDFCRRVATTVFKVRFVDKIKSTLNCDAQAAERHVEQLLERVVTEMRSHRELL